MSPSSRAPPATSRALFVILAVAASVAVANIYYAQPLAAAVGADLHATAAEVGAALTLTQVGYALGMLLFVPLGDGRERRSTIVATAAASVAALLLVAGSRSLFQLAAASLLVGTTSSVVQMILPYAVSLAPPEQRGCVVGGVMSGLLTGILLSRTVSGAIGVVLGWRAVYVLAATVPGPAWRGRFTRPYLRSLVSVRKKSLGPRRSEQHTAISSRTT